MSPISEKWGSNIKHDDGPIKLFQKSSYDKKNKLRNGIMGRNGCYFITDKKFRKNTTGTLNKVLKERNMKLYQEL
jgi:hypothetical protein